MHKWMWIFLFPIFSTSLFADEEAFTPPDEPFASSLVKTQSLLSTVVNSVSAISGEWIQSETDFVVLGPEPLILNRYYAGDHAHNDKLGYNWDFSHPRKLIIDLQDKNTQHVKVLARLHQSSGIATIHASTIHQGKLETIIPLHLSRTQGLTNCRGEISGKTNLHNTIVRLDLKKKRCTAIAGNGGVTYYQFFRQQNLSQWEPGKIGVGHYHMRALHHYRPMYEKRANGNRLLFKQGMLFAINSDQTEVYGNIQFHNEGIETLRVQASDGKSATYTFATYYHPLKRNDGRAGAFAKHRFYLSEAHFSHKPSERYEYTHRPPSTPTESPKNPLLKAKRKPDGRFEEVEYYRKGSNRLDMSIEQRKAVDNVVIDHADDFRIHRVKVIKAPVGYDRAPIMTHRFIYENERTKVYDAYMRKTIYEYNQEQRPTSIKRYGSNKKLYAEECYTWDDRYAFPAELIKDKGSSSVSTLPGALPSKKEEIETFFKSCSRSPLLQAGGAGNLLGKYAKDGKGNVLYAHFFTYDERGNITHDRLYGDLTGNQSQIIELDLHGKPKENGCECYEKRYTYSNDGFNLLKTEEEDNGKGISYDYYPKTDLVAAKYIKEHGVICLRQFFHYDGNATLVKMVKDDGCEEGEENWEGVSERLITYTYPRKKAPFGLPECIEHKYVDCLTKTEKLLKKVCCHYSLEGHLLQQDHYDANDQLCYSLYWEYDAHGNVIREVNAMGDEIVKEYDANDNLIMERGPRIEDKKEYTYDFSNRLIQVKTEADGKIWSTLYRYDWIGNRIAVIDRYGNETQYVYDDFNRLARTIYPAIHPEESPPQIQINYDCLDRPILEIDARGFSTAKRYNARGKVASISYPDGQLERFEYYLDGTLAKKIVSNGTEYHFTYDCLGRLLSEKVYSASGQLLYETHQTYSGFHKTSSTDAEGVTAYFDYDGAGRLIKTRCLDKIEIFEYDSLGRLAKKKEPFEQGKMRVTCNEYDVLDRVVEERIEDGQGHVLKKVRYAYDVLGNRTHVLEETAAGLSQHITYYNLDKKPVKMIDPEGNETHITYEIVKNCLGQLVLQTKATDPLGRQTLITYNALEHPVNVKRQDVHGILLASQNLFYDGQGHVISIVDHVVVDGEIIRSIETTFEYQERGQISCLTQAKGLIEQQITHTTYDAYGQKKEVFKSDGVILSHTYDSLGRLKRQRASDRSIDYEYYYNLRHQVLRVEDHIQRNYSQLEYDTRGRLSKETLSNGLCVKYLYDALDRVIKLTLPKANEIAYSYSALHLEKIERYLKKKRLYVHCYDAFDLAGLVLKSTTLHQQEIDFSYDLCKRVVAIEGVYFKQNEIHYDRGGRLYHYRLQDAVGVKEVNFEFDNNDHLIKESGDLQHVYQCDSLHNRISKNQVSHRINGLHQLIHNGEYTFIYDQVGNLKTKRKGKAITAYEYDALDRLITVKANQQKIRYVYDAFNRRVAKIESDQMTRYLYVGQDEIGAMDGAGNIQELRILGQGRGAEMGASIAIELQNKVYIPSHDFQGNVVALSDLAGKCVETYRYTAFGETTIYNAMGQKVLQSEIRNPWQFASKRVDEESGLVYFGRRYFDPANGRWITSDPAGLSDGPNLYAYLHHRPMQGFDLYGLQEEPYYPLQEVEAHEKKEPLPPEENKQNQEGPLGFIEKKRGKRDWMFFLGVKQIAEVGISWMNGIMNSLKDSSITAKALSEMADDHYVTFVYNRTRGFIADMVRCFCELYFYAQTPAVKNLQRRFDAFFEHASPSAFLLHYCHSEGAIITRNALMTYPEELRRRIIVVAVAPGAYIDDKYAYQVTHYRSTRDIVPFFDFVGAYRCRESTVVLNPHPDAPWFDHSVSSPTYQKIIKYHINSYMEQMGGLKCGQAA